jgi:hypothetical protein
MLTIYKYNVEPDTFIVELPGDAKVLSVRIQNQKPKMWVLLDDEAPKIPRSFVAYGTGHLMVDERIKFIGTFQLDWMVFHLFEILER